jgi:hypothetical protein
LHIVGFIAGALGASAVVIIIALQSGFSVWAAIGMGTACFVLAQFLYVILLAGMARVESRRRKSAAKGPEPVSSKPNGGVVQKG